MAYLVFLFSLSRFACVTLWAHLHVGCYVNMHQPLHIANQKVGMIQNLFDFQIKMRKTLSD